MSDTNEQPTTAVSNETTETTSSSRSKRPRSPSLEASDSRGEDSPSVSKKINLDPSASENASSTDDALPTASDGANGDAPPAASVKPEEGKGEKEIVGEGAGTGTGTGPVGGGAEIKTEEAKPKMDVDTAEPVATGAVAAAPSNNDATTTASGDAQPTGDDITMASTTDSASTGQTIQMRSLIVTQDASIIIGRQGKHIHEIREKSGARVNVSEAIPGNQERILNVGGALDAVSKAFGLIVRRINDEPFDVPSVPGSRAVNIRFIIPNSRMGSVIGKAGGKIKEIQDASGARLQASEAMLPGSTERVLTVSGVADAIHIAVYYIGTILLETSDRAPQNTAYRQQSSSSSSRPRDSYVPGQQSGLYSNYGVGGGGGGGTPAPLVNAGGGPGSQTQQIFIPNELVGSIIGKGGQKINEIRQMSSCQIKIMEPGDGGVAQSGERLVVITGQPNNIARAISLLSMRLDAEKAKLQGQGHYG